MPMEISGTDVILSDLERMIPADTDVDAALVQGAQPIAAEMQRLSPYKTGAMKGAIKVGKVRNSKRGRTVTVGVHRRDIKLTNNEYYPAYVEYGHGGPHPAPPHPFIRPGYDAKKDEAWNAVKRAVLDQMNKA